MKRLVARFTACLSAVALVVTGCAQPVDGTAETGSRDADPAFFFAGDVPLYGQTVSSNDIVALAYLRAMRRVDVCGFIGRKALPKIGEITSLGMLYALDECDIEIKLAGEPTSRFASVQLTLARAHEPVAFRAGGAPLYETAPGSCEYLMPLDLTRLPGAQPLRKPDQPYLRMGLITASDCELTKRVVGAIAERVNAEPLPARDAAAVYPTALAERDPCEVLAAIGADIDHWDVNRTRPYQCEFGVWRAGYPEVVSMRVSLEPKIVDVSTEGKEHRVSDGTDVYLDTTFCSALTFVGPPMQRRLAGGDFVDVANVVVRPAVVIDSGGAGCAETNLVVDMAATAAKLYR